MRGTLFPPRVAAAIIGFLMTLVAADARASDTSFLLRGDAASNLMDEARQIDSMQKAALAVHWNGSLNIGQRWRAVTQLRMRVDAKDQLEPGRPDQDERSSYNRRWLLGDAGDAELREMYLDGSLGPVNLRIGKQQIAWGQADGLRVLDVVNPMSFREFILPQPEDRRIALWTLNAELAFDGGSLQLLWLPDPTYDEIPLDDEIFAITTPLLVPKAPPGVPVRVMPTERPEGFFDSSDAGARLSLFAGGWDLTLNYLYHYQDDPAPFSAVTPTGIVTTPRYERSQLIGGSASNAYASTTLRSEVAYSTDRWFLTNDPRDTDKVFQSDEVAYVIGVDNTTFDNTLLSAQYFQSRVLGMASGATRDRDERQLTFLVQRSFANEALRFRALWLTSLNQHDDAVQAHLSWQMSSSWTIALSFERFYGDPRGLFGEFRDASRAGLSIEWAP
jgi:hypothetical protein